MRSATNQTGLISRDDYGDAIEEALPVPVVNTAGTLIHWGSSPARYPNLDTTVDADWFLFRGNAFSNYTITATPVGGSAVDLAVSVFDMATSGASFFTQGSNPAGPQAVVTTSILPGTGWYAVRVTTRVLSSGPYTLRIGLASTADDDFLNTSTEAYPVPNGVAQSGYLTASDVDRFQIYGRIVGSPTLTVTATGSPTPTVAIFAPNGSPLGTAPGTITVPASAPGFYTFTVSNPGTTSYPYSVTASFSCASWTWGSCDNLTSVPAIPSRFAWGDRFAGRLPDPTATATYSVPLNENESVAISLTDASPTCRFELELIPHPQLAFFRNPDPPNNMLPVFHWTDDVDTGLGPGTSDIAGTRRGAGGHFFAPVAGDYNIRVRSTSGSGCTYRLFISKANQLQTPMPEW